MVYLLISGMSRSFVLWAAKQPKLLTGRFGESELRSQSSRLMSVFPGLRIPVTILPKRLRVPSGEPIMAITVEAIYENGILKLIEPLPFPEHEKVSVTVEPKTNWVQET